MRYMSTNEDKYSSNCHTAHPNQVFEHAQKKLKNLDKIDKIYVIMVINESWQAYRGLTYSWVPLQA